MVDLNREAALQEAIELLYFVPAAMIAVPSVSPSGMSPGGDLENRSSSSSFDIFSRSSAVMVGGGFRG